MKRVLLILLFLCVSAAPVYGHAADMPPFLKINDEFTKIYQVPFPSTGEEDFFLPQDIGLTPYLVNEPIHFTLETKQLPFAPELVGQVVFLWEFGDGAKSEGVDADHTYTKPGSYFQMLYFKIDATSEPQLLQSTLLHIVPSKDYKVPKALISINRILITDPLMQVQTLSFDNEVQLSAEKLESDSPIIEYTWDFGDENVLKTDKPTVAHRYNEKDFPYGLPIVFPILRIKNKDGFIADTFAQINNQSAEGSRQGAVDGKKGLPAWPIFAGLGGFMMLTAGVYFYKLLKK